MTAIDPQELAWRVLSLTHLTRINARFSATLGGSSALHYSIRAAVFEFLRLRGS